MALVVKKFGGTSVGSIEKIKSVAQRIIADKDPDDKIVVVVSAMGDTTDDLIGMAKRIVRDPYKYPREMDMLMSIGEQQSIALLTIALRSMGQKAVSLTGSMAGVKTDSVYTKGKILDIVPTRVQEELEKGNIVVVAGFQGANEKGDPITLGRGGSDASAVALAGALKADVCEIYTDVDGIYSADPRIVKGARKMKEITYDEMLEMARLGAGVMQLRSVEIGMLYNIPIHVRSTFTHTSGTIIRGEYTMEEKNAIVKGVAHDTKVAKIAILGVPNNPGIAFSIFTALADAHVDVDMIVQNVRNLEIKTDMCFTVGLDDLWQAKPIVERVAAEMGADGVLVEEHVAKVSLIGAGMLGNPGIAAKMFGAIANQGVNIDVISTSEISISCLIKAQYVEKAANAIHEAFFPSKEV